MIWTAWATNDSARQLARAGRSVDCWNWPRGGHSNVASDGNSRVRTGGPRTQISGDLHRPAWSSDSLFTG